jgi:hypothetical protein
MEMVMMEDKVAVVVAEMMMARGILNLKSQELLWQVKRQLESREYLTDNMTEIIVNPYKNRLYGSGTSLVKGQLDFDVSQQIQTKAAILTVCFCMYILRPLS